MAIEVSIDAKGLDLFGARLAFLENEAILRAARSGVTFVARDYIKEKRSKIEKDIDRPHYFTKLAYAIEGADRNSDTDIVARAFVKDKQNDYLYWTEFGGDKTRGQGMGAIYAADEDVEDKFGGLWGRSGLERKFLRNTQKKQDRRAASGRKWRVGTKLYYHSDDMQISTKKGPLRGIWQKTKTTDGWKIKLIVASIERGEWDPQLDFRSEGLQFGEKRLLDTINRLIGKEIDRMP